MSARKHAHSRWRSANSQGFILLEVLVAMSMILGAWIVSVETYQRLALSLVQQETQRSELRKELDVFETQEQARSNANLPSKSLNHESARMSSRHRTMRTTTQSIIKGKR